MNVKTLLKKAVPAAGPALPQGTKVIRKLDSSGDTVITFDEKNEAARKEAEALLTRCLAAGGVAFKVNREGGKPDEKVTDFAGVENETVIITRIAGG